MKQRATYDRRAVGMRLQKRRKQLGWSRNFVAEELEIAEKYYGDIERGSCGMSIETLIALKDLYGLSVDFLLYGEGADRTGDVQQELMDIFAKDEALLRNLEILTPQMKESCRQLLDIFVNGVLGKDQEDIRELSDAATGGTVN